MKKCQYCGNEFDEDLTLCPNCGVGGNKKLFTNFFNSKEEKKYDKTDKTKSKNFINNKLIPLIKKFDIHNKKHVIIAIIIVVSLIFTISVVSIKLNKEKSRGISCYNNPLCDIRTSGTSNGVHRITGGYSVPIN